MRRTGRKTAACFPSCATRSRSRRSSNVRPRADSSETVNVLVPWVTAGLPILPPAPDLGTRPRRRAECPDRARIQPRRSENFFSASWLSQTVSRPANPRREGPLGAPRLVPRRAVSAMRMARPEFCRWTAPHEKAALSSRVTRIVPEIDQHTAPVGSLFDQRWHVDCKSACRRPPPCAADWWDVRSGEGSHEARRVMLWGNTPTIPGARSF